MRRAGRVEETGESRNACAESRRKKPLGIPRQRWINIIKMDFREAGVSGTD
jgi:hypothetical protein